MTGEPPAASADDEEIMVTDSVLYEVSGSLATITLNRPEARNALNLAAKEGLLDALRRAADPGIRAVLLTGAGQAFCSGQDLREHAGDMASGEPAARLSTVRQHYNPIIMAIATMPKPVVAALPGVAAGAGAALAFACDFRIAARRASFLLAFARVGLTADSGASWTLQRLAGAARAAELLMLAEPVEAEQALAMGLLTEVVDDAELASRARAFAARLAEGPTAAYAAIKDSLLFAWDRDLPGALDREADWQERLSQTADHQAAVAAFLDKRPPVFTGR
jgi:2-(1,2-epoxy-1,2-dihydrophenyl)acetyl-CoA isomerase